MTLPEPRYNFLGFDRRLDAGGQQLELGSGWGMDPDGWEQVWGPEGRELLTWVQTDPLAHRCAGALMRYALQEPVRTYVSEDVDSTCWLAYEATDLAGLIRNGFGTVDEVLCLLGGTGWWDPDSETDERPLAVAAELGILP